MDTYREIFLMQQTYATLFSLANKLQVQGDKYLEGLTLRQLMAMIAIIHLPEDEATLNNIARKLGTTKQSVKQFITILENKDYVISLPSQKDKRAVNIKITESGKRVMVQCSKKGLYFFENLFKDFTTDEMEILWKSLKKLYGFDGEEQDGFEEEGILEVDKDLIDEQMEAVKEFERRRSHN